MMRWRKHDTNTYLIDTFSDLLRVEVKIDTGRLQHIG